MMALGCSGVGECVDHLLAALVAASQPADDVAPGTCTLDGPALPGLEGCLLAFVGDLPGHAAPGQFVAGFSGVVPGVQADPDVCGQRAEVIELVQRGCQQRGVVPAGRRDTRSSGMPCPSVMSSRLLHALFPRFTGLRPAHSPPPGALVMQPPMRISCKTRPAMWSRAFTAIRSSPAKIPAAIHSSRRSRIVVAEQAPPAIDAAPAAEPQDLDQLFEDDPAALIRGRWQPSGWDGA